MGQTDMTSSSIRANSHVASGTFADGLIGQTEVIARSLSAECHGELGMFADGFVLGEEALSIAEKMAHPVSVLWALQGMGRLHLLQGNLVQAVPFLERALLTCRETNVPHLYPRIASPLGTAYCLNGRFKDAVSLLMEAVERARTRMMAHSASCYLSLGGAKLLNGYLQEAQELADVALTQSHEHQQRGQEAYSLRLLGEVAARGTPPESALAESHYRDALDLAQTLGMRPLVAHCHRALSSLYRQLDHSGSALEHLTLAKEMYRDMEMRFWLDDAIPS
jgi:tetratricopeptide (TPR) repeat protein